MYCTKNLLSRRFAFIALLPWVVLLIIGCQEIVEPTEVEEDMNLSVKVLNQSNKPLEGAMAQYAIVDYDRASPVEAVDLLAENRMVNLSGSNGAFFGKLSAPVMDVTKRLLVSGIAPPPTSVRSYLPDEPQAELIGFCEDTTVVFVFTEITEWNCGVNFSGDIDLTSNQVETGGYETAVYRSVRYLNLNGGQLTINGSTTVNDPVLSITIVVYDDRGTEINRGDLGAGPMLVDNNHSFEIEIIFSPNISIDTGDQSVDIDILLLGNPCGGIDYNLRARTIDDSGCDCPAGLDTLKYNLQAVQCISNDSIIFNIPTGFSNGDDSKCDMAFVGDGESYNRLGWQQVGGGSLSQNELDAITILEVDNIGADEEQTNFTLGPGDNVSYLTIRIDGTQFQNEGIFQVVGNYQLTLRNEDGEETDCELIPVSIEFEIQGGQCVTLINNSGTVGALDRNLLGIRAGVQTVDTVVACRNAYDPSQLRLLHYENPDSDCGVEVVTIIENVERSLDGINYQTFVGQNDVFSFVNGRDTTGANLENIRIVNPNSRTADTLAFKPDELSIEPFPGEVYGFWRSQVTLQTRFSDGTSICEESFTVYSEIRTGTCTLILGDFDFDGVPTPKNIFPTNFNGTNSIPIIQLCSFQPDSVNYVYFQNESDCETRIEMRLINDINSIFYFQDSLGTAFGQADGWVDFVLRPNRTSRIPVGLNFGFDDVYPNGICGDVDSIFNANIEIRSSGLPGSNIHCDLSSPIQGTIERDCSRPATPSLVSYGFNTGQRILVEGYGINLDLQTDRAELTLPLNGSAEDLAFYFHDVDTVLKEAQISSGGPFPYSGGQHNYFLNFFNAGNYRKSPTNVSICNVKDFIIPPQNKEGRCFCEDVFSTNPDDPSSNEGSKKVVVHEDDLIFFTVSFQGFNGSYCGVIWITNIFGRPGGGNDGGVPAVDFEICFPIQ